MYQHMGNSEVCVMIETECELRYDMLKFMAVCPHVAYSFDDYLTPS